MDNKNEGDEQKKKKKHKQKKNTKKVEFYTHYKIHEGKRNPGKEDLDYIVSVYTKQLRKVLIPVAVTMLLVVLVIRTAYKDQEDEGAFNDIMIYDESEDDSAAFRFGGALLNAVIVIAVILVVTVIMVCLYMNGFDWILVGWVVLSVFVILTFYGLLTGLQIIQYTNKSLDWISTLIIALNFGIAGTISIVWKSAKIVNQIFLIIISVLFAAILSTLPEYTTWILLVLLAIYDLIVVLSPKGPLKMLVETAEKKGKPIPGLIYSSMVWFMSTLDKNKKKKKNNKKKKKREEEKEMKKQKKKRKKSSSSSVSNGSESDDILLNNQKINLNSSESESESEINPIHDSDEIDKEETEENEKKTTNIKLRKKGNGNNNVKKKKKTQRNNTKKEKESSALLDHSPKLGLGDFIFYSLLISKAAYQDYTTVFTCFVAILMGLSLTLFFLALLQKALPALPLSILFGIIFFFITSNVLVPMISLVFQSHVFL
ncbi:presenilin [Anaeramoeba flamelloides]|uniref:Presenilin n=1 Tax=Anaeramoeba flamelloides TaxID=1746091 RepID=A0AAV7ZQV4_9EUKA|nr:presenilin [Anaeramoeba flamelloides]